MPNRAAKLKQADAKRYIAAAVQAGVSATAWPYAARLDGRA